MRHQLRPPVIQTLDMEIIDKQWLMKLLQKTYTVKALISRPIKNDCVMQTDVFPCMSCKTLSNSNLFYMILKIMCKKCHSKSLLFNRQWYVYQLVYVSQAKEIHSITMTMLLVIDDLLINNNRFFLYWFDNPVVKLVGMNTILMPNTYQIFISYHSLLN